MAQKRDLVQAASAAHKDLMRARQAMSDEEFNGYVCTLLSLCAGLTYSMRGKEFYEGYLTAAIKDPMPIELKKVKLQ